MLREYHKWFSAPLQREMELLVFGHAGERAVVFPTRQGRFFDYENWRLVEAAAPAILAGKVETAGLTTAAVMSGGNVDPSLFSAIIEDRFTPGA